MSVHVSEELCSWEPRNGWWMTPALSLGSPCVPCKSDFKLIKDLWKRHFFLIHHYKSGQRYTVPAMATNSSASGMHSLTLPPPTLPTWDTKYLVSEDSPTAFESQEIKLWEKSWKDISKRIWPGLSKKKDRELFLLGVNSSSSSGKWKNIMADL